MVAEPGDSLGAVLDSVTDSRVEERVHLEQGHLFGMFQVKPVVDGYDDKSTVRKCCATVDHVLIVAGTGDETSTKDINHTGVVRTRCDWLVYVQFKLNGIASCKSEGLLSMDDECGEHHNHQQ